MNQVEFFNNIAEKWDSKIKVDDKKISKLLSQISIKEGSDILDIGTGTGVLIPFFKQLNKSGKITAVDISEGMLKMAKRKFGQLNNVEFKNLDVEKDPIEGVYDSIILYSMFPHLKNKSRTIKKLVDNNLKNNGKLLIAHSESRDYLNNLHSSSDERVKEARLMEVNEQKEIFEKEKLKVIKAYEDDEIYYLVIEKIRGTKDEN